MVEIANLPLRVTNTGDSKTELKIETVFPGERYIRDGFELIPDLSWVRFEKSHFVLEPGETAVTDIIIEIPDKKDYLGRKFQVNIWSRTLGGGDGMFSIAAGVESILLITLDKVKREVPREKTERVNLNFTVKPQRIYIENVRVGRRVDVEKLTGQVLKIYNPDKKDHVFKIQSLTVKETLAARLEEEYEDCPGSSYLKFSEEDEFIVPQGETKEIRMYLKFPRKREYRKRKYMFIIYTTIREEDIVGGIYSRVFVKTK